MTRPRSAGTWAAGPALRAVRQRERGTRPRDATRSPPRAHRAPGAAGESAAAAGAAREAAGEAFASEAASPAATPAGESESGGDSESDGELSALWDLHDAGPAEARSPQKVVTVCTERCRSSLRAVRLAIAALGWREVVSGPASVCWREHADSCDDLAPGQVCAKLHPLLELCRKAPLARCLQQAEQAGGSRVAPRTWVVPEEMDQVKVSAKRPVIAKPTAASQGKGIVLAMRRDDLQPVLREAHEKRPYVVQEYLAPCLLEGRKFDLRLYCVLVGLGKRPSEFEAYMFEEGLARVCSVPYEKPKRSNLDQREMHLTNFAVQKHCAEFEGCASAQAAKRPARQVLEQVAADHGLSGDQLWDRCTQVCGETMEALRVPLCELGAPWRGFHIVGVDLMLDQKLRPWLLELNANPSLSLLEPSEDGPVVAELDMRLKTRLLAQALVQSRPLGHRRALGSAGLGPTKSWRLATSLGALEPLAAGEPLTEWTQAYLGLQRLFLKNAQALGDAPRRPGVGQAQLLREGFMRCIAAMELMPSEAGWRSRVDAEVWWASIARNGPVTLAVFMRALVQKGGGEPQAALPFLLPGLERAGVLDPDD